MDCNASLIYLFILHYEIFVEKNKVVEDGCGSGCICGRIWTVRAFLHTDVEAEKLVLGEILM